MTFGFIECVAISAWIPLIFMQWSRFSSMGDQSWYKSKKQRWMPPAWLFPVAWTLLYAALVIMMIFFTKNTLPDSWQLITGMVLFLFHIYWNKEWSVAFWDRNSPKEAFWILVVLMLPTSLVLYVPFIVENQDAAFYYVPVIMVTLYNAWLFFASVLNFYWLK